MIGSKSVCIYMCVCLCVATVFIAWAVRTSQIYGDECWKLESLLVLLSHEVCSLLASVVSEVRL